MRAQASLFLLSTIALGCLAAAPPDNDWLQSSPRGKVNWSSRVITVSGNGPPSLKAPNATVARLGAERAAKSDALANITEVVRSMPLDSNGTVGAMLDRSPELKSQIGELVKNFKTLDTRYFADGGVDVVAEIALDGGLGELLVGAVGTAAPAAAAPAEYTGVVLNAKGLKLTAALAPRIYSDTQQELYSAASVARDGLHQRGAAAYSKSLEAALKDGRVADKPLIVRAIAARGSTDLVVTAADAAKLATLGPVLAMGRIMIILD